MKALILAAGFGTRLTKSIIKYNNKTLANKLLNKPKALIPFKNKPILSHQITQLNKSNFNNENILIHTNKYFYPQFLIWAKENNFPIKNIKYNDVIRIEEKLGQFNDLLFAIKNFNINEDLILLASDTLVYENNNLLNFSKLIKNNSPKIVVYECNSNLSNHGIIEEENNFIKSFEEKPNNPKSNLACASIYFYPKEMLKKLKSLKNIKNPIEHFYKTHKIQVIKADKRIDIGTIYDLIKNDKNLLNL